MFAGVVASPPILPPVKEAPPTGKHALLAAPVMPPTAEAPPTGVRALVSQPILPQAGLSFSGPRGVPGAQGIPGVGAAGVYDSTTPPTSPPATYLRFARDIDGHVQTIYLGTTT